MFHTVPPEERIDASDAEIVDVIHTAGLWVGTDGVVSAWNEFTLKLSGENPAHFSSLFRCAKSKQVESRLRGLPLSIRRVKGVGGRAR